MLCNPFPFSGSFSLQNAVMSFQTMYLIYIFVILFCNFWVYACVCILNSRHPYCEFYDILLQTVQSGCAAVCITLHVNMWELAALTRYNLNYPLVQFFCVAHKWNKILGCRKNEHFILVLQNRSAQILQRSKRYLKILDSRWMTEASSMLSIHSY